MECYNLYCYCFLMIINTIWKMFSVLFIKREGDIYPFSVYNLYLFKNYF